MKDKLNALLLKAWKVFWQATIASLVITIPEILELIPMGWAVLKPVLFSAGIGAVASGVSACWDGVIEPMLEKAQVKKAEEKGGEAPDDESK